MKFGREDYSEHEETNYNLMLNDLRHMNPKHISANFHRKKIFPPSALPSIHPQIKISH